MTEGNSDLGGRRLDGEVNFGVLGPVTVTEGTTGLSIGGPKQRTVLAMLIAHVGYPISVDHIVTAVWGEDATPNARRIVQTYVATLRAQVGDAIVKTGPGWQLDVPFEQIDALAFEDLYHSAREVLETNPQRASVALREALAMWRGHPYAEIEAHGTLDGEKTRLSELRVAAQAARIAADLALGRDADLVGEIEVLMAEHPYSEGFRSQHMLSLYRAGRQQEALRSYQKMRNVLLDELGIDPTHDLQDLERRILEQDESLRVTPTQTVQRRAILVADPGDPIEIGHLPAAERQELLTKTTLAIQGAIDREGSGLTLTAGSTTYVVFDSVLMAANVAESVTRRLDEHAMRVAIDWGEVVLESGMVNGPPVSRAAVMAAVAHRGQVLLSAEAQQAMGNSGSGRGLRFEQLGNYDLHSIEGNLLIYQLLVGDMPPVFPELETHRLPPPLPGGGNRSVPGYELREELGPGSVGILYRAFQPSVGREVLIEVIGRAEASSAAFIRSFEADAQRLSLLDHQNIAPVIDYWRQPDGAFLVYRYPRGGLLSQGREVDAGQLVADVGSALSYAHSLGMVHGSLRPDRVALDEAGNASLLCFPLATVEPPTVDEYRQYVAPEVREGEAPTIEADIYALGVLARELGIDSPAADRATHGDIERRPHEVAAFLIDLNPTASDSPADRYTQTRNPYKGLAAFLEKDEVDFFGRSAATEELCRTLGGSRLLAIVGPSGIGKSSAARAGLVPALRAGRLPGSETWLITDMLPGSHPFFELQRALERIAVRLPVPLTEALATHDPDALVGVGAALPDGAELVVLVDQFEELFTMVAENEREAFLDLVATSVGRGSARFIITLRADFLDRPLRYSEFGRLLKTSTVMLAAPNPEELAEVIVKPAQGVGVEVAPELVERLVTEVHDQPGALPLLQHTLAELFTSRRSDLIEIVGFEEAGGVSGSLARRSESIYSDLDHDGRSAIRQVFLRLVTIVDERAPTRRRVRMTELGDLDAEDAIEAFARSRLLVFDNDPETRTPTVEVAHEALLTHWPRLAGWIDAAREDLTLLRRLDEARQDWEANGRDPAYVLTGGRLAQHQAWTSSTSLVLSDAETNYLEESRRHDDRLRARSRRRRGWVVGGFAAAAAVALVFAFSASNNARIADAERLVASAAAVAETDPELALLLARHAFDRSPSLATQAALHQGIQVKRNLMVIAPPPGSVGAVAAVDPDGRMVAVAGSGTAVVQMWEIGSSEPTWEVTVSDDPGAALWSLASIWLSADGERIFLPLSPSGLGTGAPADTPAVGLYVLDARNGETVDFVRFPCFGRATPAGTQFASGPLFAIEYLLLQEDGTCDELGGSGILEIETGEVMFEMQNFAGTEPTMSSDGRLLAVNGEFLVGGPYETWTDIPKDEMFFQGTRVFNTMTGDVVFETEVETTPAVLSPNGQRLLTNSNPVYLYDIASGERQQTYQGDLTRLLFADEEALVVGASPRAGAVHLFDTESGTELLRMRGHTEGVRSVRLSADGRIAVSSGFDAARIWDAIPTARGDLGPIDLPPHEATPFYLDAISASEELLLTRRANLRIVGPIAHTIPYQVDVIDKRDGAHLWGGDVWAAELGRNGIAFVQRVVERDVVSPSGVEGAIKIGRPELVEGRSGRHLRYLEGCGHYSIPGVYLPEAEEGCDLEMSFDFYNLQFSADNSRLSGATQFGELVVWDVESGEIVRWDEPALTAPRFRLQGYRWAAALSLDGSQIVVPPSESEWSTFSETAEAPSMVIEDLVSGAEQGGFEVDRWVDYLTFVPQTGQLVGSHTDLLIIDPDTWEVTRVTRAQGGIITDLAVSPDGSLVATTSLDGYVVVWSLEEERIVTEFPVLGHLGEGLRGVAFVDNETIVAAPELGDQLLRFTLDQDLLVETAQQNLNRGFRSEECATYDIDPCPTLEEMLSGS